MHDQANKDYRDGPNRSLTLAMIVRDGGQNLACLLKEAGSWTDAIIVGDTGSTDGSAATARNAGALVLDIPWHDDFAAARNAVLEACPAGWILVLDDDELLSPADWAQLRAWCDTHDAVTAPVGLVFATRNYLSRPDRRGWRPVPVPDPHALPTGAPADGYVASRKVRLFPARADVRFQGILHETVEADLASAGIDLHAAPWPVHHFGMLNEDPAKAHHYLEMARRKTARMPRNARAWSELADCAVACNRDAEALGAAECGLALDPDDPDLGLTGAEVMRRLSRTDTADRLLSRVVESTRAVRHQRATAAHLRARIALETNRTAEAGPHILQALRLDPGDPHALNTLGVWHLLRGDNTRAEHVLRRAAARLPGSAEPRLNLGRLHLREGRWEQARLWLEGALQVDPDCDKAREALRRIPRTAQETV